VYVGLEEEASEIRTYEPELIPGLLQTEGYSRAVVLADVEVPPDDEVEQSIAVRMRRQERLQGEDAPKMWVVLNEAALRREVGGPETMREQLRHLIEVSRPNKVVIQVLSYGAGAHPAMDGSFVILRFPEPADPDVAYVQYRRGSLYLEEPSDVGAYAEVFDHLRARALGPDESRALIGRMADQMT
jgi:hypothetical protein